MNLHVAVKRLGRCFPRGVEALVKDRSVATFAPDTI
jgi:hypothetical protein